ncbi:MAG: sodium:glutamate symporter [Tissierellia bacterium]|nr:sodium:glutamate symporter [Tissierellia bacterium]
MFPKDVVTAASLDSLLFSLSLLGLLIFIGTILRIKVGIFKKLFIPASLIAGALGLILGQYGLGLLPKEITATWGALPGRLITVVFAPMLMGMEIPKVRKVWHKIAPQLYFSYIGDFIQIAVPFLISALILEPIWKVNVMFASIVEIGWAGGHGTAGGMIDVFSSLNWSDGGDLGLTSATAGLFMGIVGGMIIINYGVRKGYTSVLKSEDQIKGHMDGDIIPQGKRKANSIGTLNNDVVESYAFHLALIGIAILLGWIIQGLIEKYIGIEMPLFPMAMIGGLIVQVLISKTEYNKAVDPQTLQRIQGMALDFLIASAVASISIPVVVKYGIPFLILMLVSAVVLLFFFFWAGPRMFKSNWFENSIVNYGFLSGVAAVGLMLLRVTDPNMETEAGESFALRTPLFEPFLGGGLITSLLPVFALKYGSLKVGIAFLILTILGLILAKVTGFWNNKEIA